MRTIRSGSCCGTTEGREFHISCSRQSDLDIIDGVRDRFKIILIGKGSCIVKSKAERFVLIPPSLILLDEKSRIEAVKKEDLEFTLLAFHPDFINSRFDFDNIRSAENRFSATETQDVFFLGSFLKRDMTVSCTISPTLARAVGVCLRNIERTLTRRERDSWPCDARYYLMELLFHSTNDPGNARGISTLHTGAEYGVPECGVGLDIDGIIQFLNLNYNKKAPIAKMAAVFGTNRTTLCRCFKKATGLSIKQYVLKLRVQVAASMLQGSNAYVREVMERVGYSDASHFLKAFKKYTGFTPSHFRRANMWIAESIAAAPFAAR